MLNVRALRALVFSIAIVLTSSGHAAPDVLTEHLTRSQSRFQPYEPNYAIWQYTDNDDDALEARYSFKYFVTPPDCLTESFLSPGSEDDCVENYWNRTDVYLKFSGEFDFYFGTRESGPVINRELNPGIHVRKYTNNKALSDVLSWTYWDLGFQHLSNGQTTEAELRRDGGFRAQAFYDINPFSPYFDTISRGVDFVSFESKFRLGRNARNGDEITGRCDGSTGCWDVWLRLLPYYINDNNPVTWGPSAGVRRYVADYERARVIISRKRDYLPENSPGIGLRSSELTITWTVGDDLLDTDSVDIGLFLPIQLGRRISIPFFIEYHSGPMNNLSNYTQEQDSIGFGLRFY